MVVSYLLENAVTFEPVGNVTNVFFDDKNQQVFSVRSGGATGVLVRGFRDELCSTFRLEDKGPIISIKMSPDQSVLAVQRQKNMVQFIGVTTKGPNGVLDTANEYSQSCRSKSSTILGYYWNTSYEIVYLTNHGIEIYSVLHERKTVKYIRCLSHPITWFAYCVRSYLLVTSSCSNTSVLQPFLIRTGTPTLKLPKIELDKTEVREKDVHLANIYGGQMYILVILHPSAQAVQNVTSTDIHMYFVTTDGTAVTRTHILKAPFVGGGIALNLSDNVLMIHHRATETTALFDIALSVESDGQVSYHNQPVVPPLKVIPSKSSMATLHKSGSNVNLADATEKGYSQNWVTFMPNVVIDAKEGIMWKLKLKLESGNSKQVFTDLPKLVGFLQQRVSAKLVLVDILLEWCNDPTTDLTSIGAAFNLISHEYRLFLDVQMMSNMALPVSPFSSGPSPFPVTSPMTIRSPAQPMAALAALTPQILAPVAHSNIPAKVILDQADLYTNLFTPLVEDFLSGRHGSDESVPRPKRIVSIVMEYLRSLEERQIPVQHFLNELLINLLVRQKSFFLLHQLLQYHVISDSKPLACLLLSLENVYPASYQLALDMLARLKNSAEEICEILLSKGNVLSAVRYARGRGIETVPAQKFLEAAKANNEDFYTTYTFLKERNLLPRGCAEYTKHFQTLFGTE